MSNEHKGQFYVGQEPDGRFVAASNCSPFFCIRAETEEAVLAKVKRSFEFYVSTKGKEANIKIEPVSKTVTTIRSFKKHSIDELLAA